MATDVKLALASGEIEVIGRLVEASNATLFCSVEYAGEQVHAVYKPVIGEEPLWDFPNGTLSNREFAAYQVSDLLGWNIVPTTILRDGPYGHGMLQEWVEIDEEVDRIALAQSNDPQIARMAVFDALINNTDRKIGHLLPDAGGHIYGCDHGVSFHHDPKLRTVIWQFRGQPIPESLLEDLDRLSQAAWQKSLDGLLSPVEIDAVEERLTELLRRRLFPMPSPSWPAIPWPPI